MKCWGLFFVVQFGCNPFLAQGNGLNQPCQSDTDCLPSLICYQGYCQTGQEDGGVDAADTDDSLDCALADCTLPAAQGQGPDKDGDDWGTCCDCDDEDEQIHPLRLEVPYNDKDDDCDVSTPDRDLDSDGHDDSDHGGDDCDDNNPDVYPGMQETCNGIDDNCDTNVDEGFGVGEPCEAIGECPAGVFECSGDDSTVCSTMPGGSDDRSENEICDGLDNDCDGETDEGAQLLLLAETGAQAEDGKDNNCNGLVDEPGGVMVPAHGAQNKGVWIDSYEMTVYDSQDCTGIRYGENFDDYPEGFPADGSNATTTLYACSLPGKIPSGYLSYFRAARACLAQGKRLCTKYEYLLSCSVENGFYPYDGQAFQWGYCNDPVMTYPQRTEFSPIPAGSMDGCSARGYTFDMSGNLAEWIYPSCGAAIRECPQGHEAYGILLGWSYSNLLCPDGDECSPYSFDFDHPILDAISQATRCSLPQNFHFNIFPRDTLRPDFGARCCLDGP